MKSCVNCAHCSDKKFASQCEGCQGGKHWEAKPMTQADFLRTMSDEDLAQFLLDFFVGTMDINGIAHEEVTEADKLEILRQIQQPLEGE